MSVLIQWISSLFQCYKSEKSFEEPETATEAETLIRQPQPISHRRDSYKLNKHRYLNRKNLFREPSKPVVSVLPTKPDVSYESYWNDPSSLESFKPVLSDEPYWDEPSSVLPSKAVVSDESYWHLKDMENLKLDEKWMAERTEDDCKTSIRDDRKDTVSPHICQCPKYDEYGNKLHYFTEDNYDKWYDTN